MSKIFGRSVIVKQIWKTLENESILFVAERRIGKTTVLDCLRDTPHSDYIIIYSDVEGVVTPLQFVEKIISSYAMLLLELNDTKLAASIISTGLQNNPESNLLNESLLNILNIPNRYLSNRFKQELESYASQRRIPIFIALNELF